MSEVWHIGPDTQNSTEFFTFFCSEKKKWRQTPSVLPLTCHWLSHASEPLIIKENIPQCEKHQDSTGRKVEEFSFTSVLTSTMDISKI